MLAKKENGLRFLKISQKNKKTSRRKIQSKVNFFITKDASLNLKKFHNLKIVS